MRPRGLIEIPGMSRVAPPAIFSVAVPPPIVPTFRDWVISIHEEPGDMFNTAVEPAFLASTRLLLVAVTSEQSGLSVSVPEPLSPTMKSFPSADQSAAALG